MKNNGLKNNIPEFRAGDVIGYRGKLLSNAVAWKVIKINRQTPISFSYVLLSADGKTTTERPTSATDGAFALIDRPLLSDLLYKSEK